MNKLPALVGLISMMMITASGAQQSMFRLNLSSPIFFSGEQEPVEVEPEPTALKVMKSAISKVFPNVVSWAELPVVSGGVAPYHYEIVPANGWLSVVDGRLRVLASTTGARHFQVAVTDADGRTGESDWFTVTAFATPWASYVDDQYVDEVSGGELVLNATDRVSATGYRNINYPLPSLRVKQDEEIVVSYKQPIKARKFYINFRIPSCPTGQGVRFVVETSIDGVDWHTQQGVAGRTYGCGWTGLSVDLDYQTREYRFLRFSQSGVQDSLGRPLAADVSLLRLGY